MPLEMVDAEGRHAERGGERVGEGGPGEQSAGKAGALRIGDRPELRNGAAGTREHVPGEGYEAPDMVARGELGDHAAVGFMHLDLGVHHVREQPPGRGVVQRHAGLVAGGLDAEDQHGGILIQFRPFEFTGHCMPTVRVKENEPFEVAMRRFKRTVEKTGLLTELRAREFYEKPTSERKRKLAAAVKRHHKRLRSQMLPAKLY